MNAHQRVGKLRKVLTALFALVLGGFLFICGGVALLGFYIDKDLRPDPVLGFTRHTGIQWPHSATVVFHHDDHGLPFGDGESHIVFDADGNLLDKWLAESPPWKVGEWQAGPVRDDIKGHCLLRHDNAELLRLLDSPDIQYAVVARGPKAMPWHNGCMLLIDRANNRVWLFVWDN